MLNLLSFVAAITLMLPVAASAAPPLKDLPGGLDVDDLGTHNARGKSATTSKKGGKGKAEPATPPPPPPDADEDGVIDADDKCVDQPEDMDGFEDDDGCPDPDNDGDGIADGADSCPNEAENVDGWDDADGCPEAAPSIAPFMIDATLMDGTHITGKVIRIVAVDEDEAASEPFEPTVLGVVVDEEAEFETSWTNVRALTSEKVNFTEAIDCYSEGVQDLGDAPTWECTLKHPTVLKLATSDKKGTHRVLDRKMHRLDFKIDAMTCEGTSCEAIEAARGVSWYLYKMLAFEKSEEESEAVAKLQRSLRETQKLQVKTATLKPVE